MTAVVLTWLLPNSTTDAIAVYAGPAGSGGVWGSITGSIADQSDLQTALGQRQPLDPDLTAIAALTSAADKAPYATGAGAWALYTLTAYGRTLASSADAAAAKASLALSKSDVGLGSVENTALSTWAGSANITTLGTVGTGAWQGSAVGVAYGGTGAGSASGARSNLGLAIGSNVQAWDTDLDAIAGLSPSNDDLIQRKAGVWTNRTPAQLKTDLALAKGDVGLGNVDNTSDANKPISTATQTALDAKYTSSWGHPGYVSSRWYAPSQRVAAGNITLTIDRLQGVLVEIMAPVTIRGLGAYVSTGGAASSVKFALYSLTGGVPVTRLGVTGAVASATSSVFVSADFSADLTLTPGWYVAAVISNGSPRLASNTASDYPVAQYLGSTTGANVLNAGTFVTGWYNDLGTYTAGPPSSFGAVTESTGNSPLIAFQVR